MNIKYINLKSASKDIFRNVMDKEKKEVNFDNFINSLKNINIQDINIIKEIERIIDSMKVRVEVKNEILKRLKEKQKGE